MGHRPNAVWYDFSVVGSRVQPQRLPKEHDGEAFRRGRSPRRVERELSELGAATSRLECVLGQRGPGVPRRGTAAPRLARPRRTRRSRKGTSATRDCLAGVRARSRSVRGSSLGESVRADAVQARGGVFRPWHRANPNPIEEKSTRLCVGQVWRWRNQPRGGVVACRTRAARTRVGVNRGRRDADQRRLGAFRIGERTFSVAYGTRRFGMERNWSRRSLALTWEGGFSRRSDAASERQHVACMSL